VDRTSLALCSERRGFADEHGIENDLHELADD
jgi:hypothetical protein